MSGSSAEEDARGLQKELIGAGIEVLALTPHPTVPDAFTVFLHGPAGQWIEGAARRAILRLPRVVGVTESAVSETILVVYLGVPDEPAAACEQRGIQGEDR